VYRVLVGLWRELVLGDEGDDLVAGATPTEAGERQAEKHGSDERRLHIEIVPAADSISKPMHPNMFLKGLWQAELRPQVFVAMNFGPAYLDRFTNVIAPAVAGVELGKRPLTAVRVDNSKTGESILTEIIDGIAHSQLVLADVSTAGRDSVTGDAYRNGNVMYEVGIALACRQPAEVILLLRRRACRV